VTRQLDRPTAPEPEAPADALARLYDLDLEADPGDLDLWLALAARADGPVLELAAGTGRLAVPLAEAGHRVVAVDFDPAMLRRARARLDAASPAVRRRVELVEADARDVRLATAGTFGLAFVGLNSLVQVGDRADQLAVVRTLAAHLAVDGVAGIDVWLPDAEDLARFDGRITLEYPRLDPGSGRLVTKAASAIHDATRGTVRLSVIYEEGRQGEPAVRWFREDLLRLVGPDELRWFAEEAGLEVELLAGGYDLEPLAPGCDRAVLVARRGVS
jgi:SAM-dependent methyltransferase